MLPARSQFWSIFVRKVLRHTLKDFQRVFTTYKKRLEKNKEVQRVKV